MTPPESPEIDTAPVRDDGAADTPPPVVADIRHLAKTFPPHFDAVKHVTFSIHKGDLFGFIGPNGAGKTTTMRMLTTLEEPTAGDALICGYSLIHETEAVRRHIGFMPDYYEPYEGLTIDEYLDFFAGAFKVPRARRRQVIDDACEITGIETIKAKFVHTLSKGLKQRLMLAKTLLHDPALLILDEPAAGLDPRARIEFRELLLDLVDMGKTIMISSHILTELSDMVTRVAIIESGRIVTQGTVEEALDSAAGGPAQTLTLLIECLEPRQEIEAAVRDHPDVHEIQWVGEKTLGVIIGNDTTRVAGLARHLVQSGFSLTRLEREKRNLETLFMATTKGTIQ